MFPEDDGVLDWDMPDDEEDSNEDSPEAPQSTQTAEHQRQENEFRAVAQGDADSESDREDAWLAAIQSTPGKKRVCFEVAKRGTCERLKTQGHCPYSHDDEDCEKFRAAKKLGKDTIENIAKEITNRGPQGRLYEKTHTDGSPKGFISWRAIHFTASAWHWWVSASLLTGRGWRLRIVSSQQGF